MSTEIVRVKHYYYSRIVFEEVVNFNLSTLLNLFGYYISADKIFQFNHQKNKITNTLKFKALYLQRAFEKPVFLCVWRLGLLLDCMKFF